MTLSVDYKDKNEVLKSINMIVVDLYQIKSEHLVSPPFVGEFVQVWFNNRYYLDGRIISVFNQNSPEKDKFTHAVIRYDYQAAQDIGKNMNQLSIPNPDGSYSRLFEMMQLQDKRRN